MLNTSNTKPSNVVVATPDILSLEFIGMDAEFNDCADQFVALNMEFANELANLIELERLAEVLHSSEQVCVSLEALYAESFEATVENTDSSIVKQVDKLKRLIRNFINMIKEFFSRHLENMKAKTSALEKIKDAIDKGNLKDADVNKFKVKIPACASKRLADNDSLATVKRSADVIDKVISKFDKISKEETSKELGLLYGLMTNPDKQLKMMSVELDTTDDVIRVLTLTKDYRAAVEVLKEKNDELLKKAEAANSTPSKNISNMLSIIKMSNRRIFTNLRFVNTMATSIAVNVKLPKAKEEPKQGDKAKEEKPKEEQAKKEENK